MLNLQKLIQQINNMSSNRLDWYQALCNKLVKAQKMLQQSEYDFILLEQKRSLAKTSWLIAQPLESLKIYSLPLMPSVFQVLAVDGSQIVPDHHEITLCYLINTGAVLLAYGSPYEPILESTPKLFYKEEELYQDYRGQKILIQGENLALVRAMAEVEKLGQLVSMAKLRAIASVALFDGTMIQWKLESRNNEDNDWKGRMLDSFLTSLEDCRLQELPVAGYVSGSRSNDVVNLLRLGLCPDHQPNCDNCNHGLHPPCSELEGITDATLFKGLPIGARTSAFYSSSKILNKYGQHKIAFFYINVGPEIARIEVPKWVAENQDYLSLVHAIVFDQAQKGFGYPVALSEAHELAVIKGSDREFFFNLLAKNFVQKGIPVEITNKSLAKRRPFV